MRKGCESCWGKASKEHEAEGRRKLVVGGVQAAIKYFKGSNVEETLGLFFVFMTPKEIKGLLDGSHWAIDQRKIFLTLGGVQNRLLLEEDPYL